MSKMAKQTEVATTTCLNTCQAHEQALIIDELNAMAEGIYAKAEQKLGDNLAASAANMQAAVEADRHDPNSDEPEAQAHMIAHSALLLAAVSLAGKSGKMRQPASRALTTVKERMGEVACETLKKLYPEANSRIHSTSDPYAMIDLLQKYWTDIFDEGSKWTKTAMIFIVDETSEPANSSYTRAHQVNVNRLTADNNGDSQLAECLTISTLGTYDLNVMKNVDARFKWLNGIGADSPAFEFLNYISFPEMLRLMDEEVRPFRATPAAIGLHSEAKNASDGCIWHPGSDHSNAECKAQMRTAGPPGSAKAKAPMVCFTCQQPGHHKRQCHRRRAPRLPRPSRLRRLRKRALTQPPI